MLVLSRHSTREDEMHPTITSQIAAQRIAELHQQAARQRLVRQLGAAGAVGAASPRNGRVRAGWARVSLRRSWPAAA
jgi:hypothetical protein